MPTIARGNTAEIYVPVYDELTITPGAGGSVHVGVAVQSAADTVAPRTLYAAATISIPGGSTVFAEAIGADATYNSPTGANSPVSGDGGAPVVADLAALLALPSPSPGMLRRTQQPVIGAVENGGVQYLDWIYLGPIDGWRLKNRQELLIDFSVNTGQTGGTQNKIVERVISANLFPRLRYFEAVVSFAKSGAAETSTAHIRLGENGLSSDFPLRGSSIALSASQRQVSVGVAGYFEGSPDITRWVNGQTSINDAVASGVAYPAGGSVGALTSDLVLSVWAAMGGASETLSVTGMIVWGR
jgi:hypothetical protein